MIARMLLVDPLKRVTISEIRAHPWFVVHLPRYLVVPPPDTLAQATNVDAETLDMVVNLGFEREHVVDALRHQLRNKATVAYFCSSITAATSSAGTWAPSSRRGS